MKKITSTSLLAGILLFSGFVEAAPLKVYLMAGQSNMQGFCAVHTFPQIESDPVTKPIYEKMLNPDGTPQMHENGDRISDAPYHYLGSYKIYSRIGKAFADAMVGMSK